MLPSIVQRDSSAPLLADGSSVGQDLGGAPREQLAAPIAASCAAVGRTRVTQILFDRHDPQLVWAGIEVDGVYRSRDAGKTWDKRVNGLHSEDLHVEVVRPHQALESTRPYLPHAVRRRRLRPRTRLPYSADS